MGWMPMLSGFGTTFSATGFSRFGGGGKGLSCRFRGVWQFRALPDGHQLCVCRAPLKLVCDKQPKLPGGDASRYTALST